MPPNDWSSFWKKTNDAFDQVMQVATHFFYQQLRNKFQLDSTTSVLDYGCGPGFLVANLVTSGVRVTGVDISDSFLERSRTKFPGATFIKISEETGTTFKILSGSLRDKKFDFIILLSIVQYFRSQKEVEDVIGFLKNHLESNGKIIVADVIHEHTSSSKDAIGIFKQCIRKGRTLAFAKFIMYLVFSDYRNVSQHNKMLLLSGNMMKQIADNCLLAVDEVKGMTPHPTRTNYIFTNI